MKSVTRKYEIVERDLELFDLELEDVQIWRLVRKPVFSLVSGTEPEGQIGREPGRVFREYSKALIAFSKNLVYKNPLLSKEHDIVSVGNGRRKQVDGIYYDIYCDPILELDDFDILHLERHWRLEHPKPAATHPMRYLDIITHGSAILRALGLFRPEFSDVEQQRLRDLQSALEQSFGTMPSVRPVIENRVHRHKTTLNLFKYLLGKIDPELLLIVCSYGQETLMQASQSQSTPVVELQHGVIHPDDLGYSFPQDTPVRPFPDYLLVWGEFWRQNADFPLPDDRIIPVGYPWLEQGINQYAGVTPSDQVLFISQPGYGCVLL